MPPKKTLQPGQVPADDIAALEQWVVDELGESQRYRALVDADSMRAAGATRVNAPRPVPRFQLVVDTAEQDYEFLVRRLRGMQIWAIARSMKRPPAEAYDKDFFAGDFATIEYTDDFRDYVDDDDDREVPSGKRRLTTEAPEHHVPRGYRCLVDAERKSLDDLISSFSDGRRQRQRAEHAGSSARRHLYIIEGNINELTGKKAMWIKNINSDLDHLAYDGPFGVRQINTHADLVPTLFNMVRYPAKGVLDGEANITPMMAYALSGKKAKKRDLNSPDTVWSGMLQAVPGVSAAAAGAIIGGVYPTMLDFARALVKAADDPDERATMTRTLRDVHVPTQNSSSSRSSTRLASHADKLMHMATGTEMEVSKSKRGASSSSSSSRHPKKQVVESDDDNEYAYDSFVEQDSPSPQRQPRRRYSALDSDSEEEYELGKRPVAMASSSSSLWDSD